MKKKSLLIITLLFTSCNVLPMQILKKVIYSGAKEVTRQPERIERCLRFFCPCIAGIIVTGATVKVERAVNRGIRVYIGKWLDFIFGEIKTG